MSESDISAFEKMGSISARAVFIVALVLFVGSGWLYWNARHVPEKVGQVIEAIPAKEVAKTPKVSIPVKKVKAYPGVTKGKLNLPPSIVNDPNQHVIASTKAAATDHPTTTTTVLNDQTGESTTYVRTDPLPLIAFESRGSIGAYYGIKAGEPTLRIQAHQDFVQVKALHVGVIGSVDRTMATGRTDYFVGVGVAYKW